jgi:hypothetical protein
MVTITLSLMAREERLPPLGLPPDPNRDIGFATVMVRLNNPCNVQQTISIDAIEIRCIADQQRQPFTFKPRTLELKPLENSVVDLHLTNTVGFLCNDSVQAVVNVRQGSGPSATLCSEATAIEGRSEDR